MKKVVYFIIVSLLVFTSCKKDGSNPVNADTVPTPPTLTSPTDTSSNIAVPVVLTWKESSGAKSSTLQVSASSSFSSFVFNKSDITTTTQQVPDINYLSIYYWRVSATNSAGTSDWSKVWSFTTTKDEPALIPQLSLPTNGAVDQKLSPVLTWNIVNNANRYRLQLSTNSSFTSFVLDEDSLNTTTKQINDLSGSTTYYWRVRATNNFGTKGWTETWSLTTGVAPVPPVLLSPTDGATNVTFSPTLSWATISGATGYTLQVSTNNSFTSYVFNQSVTIPNKQIMGLINSTKYYWRVSSTNNYGTSAMSSIWSFTTDDVICGSQLFYAEKTYTIVEIGNQCWLKENLDVGSMILGSVDASNNSTIEKYCYDNNTANCATYGGLYKWNEAMAYSITPGTKGICPTGWHIPTKVEFETLMALVSNDGNKLKREDQGTGNGTGTNTIGFSALLAGYRNSGDYFDNLGHRADFWSSTEYTTTAAYSMYLRDNDSSISVGVNYYRTFGFSIRCLKDY